MDLINPYMRHHSFANQNNSPSANRSPPLHHMHTANLTNGFVVDTSHTDYQSVASRDHLLDYHSAAAVAYAANNNNLSSSLMLLKGSKSGGGNGMDMKLSRSGDDSSTPPPLLPSSTDGGVFRAADQSSIASSRLQSESPDCNNSVNNRSRYDNSSPGVDSSKSYPVSHRSSEEAGNSESSPPPPDCSPENLSSRKYCHSSMAPSNISLNNSNSHQFHSNNNMLDHKLPLSFLGPPLAALHSMTEMKSGTGLMGASAGSTVNVAFSSSPSLHISRDNGGIMSTALITNTTTHTQANPHGIDTILSKPPPVTSSGLSALTGGKIKIVL